MQRDNAPASSAELTACTQGPGYISNADRLHTDTAGEEYQRRQEDIQKKQRAIDFRRNQRDTREEERWKSIDEQGEIENKKWDKLREDGSKSGKNVSGFAYDITTMQYHDSADGAQQKYIDDKVRLILQDTVTHIHVQTNMYIQHITLSTPLLS